VPPRHRAGADDRCPRQLPPAAAIRCAQAAEHGLLVHIEYFPLSGISDLRTAFELARRSGAENGGVLVDTWHEVRGPSRCRLDLDVPGEAILAVQVNDVAATAWEDAGAEMMYGRLLPGEGAGAIAELLAELRSRGCTAPFAVEVYSDDLHARGPDTAARLCAGAMGKMLGTGAP
jgi:sugar phosphate isomerase/epimerase